MSPFDAFQLPIPVPRTEHFQAGTLSCRYPPPDPLLYEDVIHRLRDAGAALAERPVLELVEVIDAAAARLLDPEDPLRRQAERLLPAATGYSEAMVRLVLDRMAADWRAAPLRSLLKTELGDAAVLDRFTPNPDARATRAFGPRLAFHVFAGNVPGVAVTALVRSILAKAPTLAKTASGEPVLPVLFARALAAIDPPLADAIAVAYWPGGSEAVEWRALQAADVVVVYGGEEAVGSLRRRIPPHARLVAHGPRFSVGMVGREALEGELGTLARDVALAAATFDQQGCVSPHAVWVEDDGRDGAARFAAAVADALAALETELPRGRISAGEASAIQQLRGAAEMRGHDGQVVTVLAPEGTDWTVVHDPDPTFRPSCLNRFLHVHPIPDLADAAGLLAPIGRHLQSVAIAAAGDRLDRLARDLGRIGAARITSFARLPWPPPTWHHDGRGPLRELLRWVDLER